MEKDTPKSGDVIYIPSEMFVSHGSDDIVGGKARITAVKESGDRVWVMLERWPYVWDAWECLLPQQGHLKEAFGDSWAYPSPDLRAEFNKWD